MHPAALCARRRPAAPLALLAALACGHGERDAAVTFQGGRVAAAVAPDRAPPLLPADLEQAAAPPAEAPAPPPAADPTPPRHHHAPAPQRPTADLPPHALTDPAPDPDLDLDLAPACDLRCRGGAQRGDHLLTLVDRDHGLRDTWEPPDLIALDPPYVIPEGSPPNLLRAEAARAFVALSDAAFAATGVRVNIRSGYRPFALQCGIFKLEVARAGCAEAARASAPAGHSEHQLGTTADLAVGWRRLTGDAPIDAYLAAHAHEHGWVLSFPDGSEPATGIKHEPWHYRYLGPAAAADLVARSRGRRLSTVEYLAPPPAQSITSTAKTP